MDSWLYWIVIMLTVNSKTYQTSEEYGNCCYCPTTHNVKLPASSTKISCCIVTAKVQLLSSVSSEGSYIVFSSLLMAKSFIPIMCLTAHHLVAIDLVVSLSFSTYFWVWSRTNTGALGCLVVDVFECQGWNSWTSKERQNVMWWLSHRWLLVRLL